MKFAHTVVAVLFLTSFSDIVFAQGIYLKATKSNSSVITTGAGPYASSGVADAHGSGTVNLANYATVESMGFDIERAISFGGQQNASELTFKPFTISKRSDASSTQFSLAQFRGDLMTIEIITVANSAQNDAQVVMHKIILRNAGVSAYSVDGGGDCLCMVETISFDYGIVEIYSYTMNQTGKVSPGHATGWDRITNKVVTP